MRLIRDSAQDRLERLLPDDASDRASLLASSTGRPPPPRRIINSGLVSRRCWFSTRRVSDEVNGRLPSTPRCIRRNRGLIRMQSKQSALVGG